MLIKNRVFRVLKPMVVLVLMIMLIPTKFVNAANLGTLSVWKADVDTIRRWGATVSTIPTAVYVNKLNSNASFYFASAIDLGLSKRNSALGTNIKSYGYTNSNVPIVYYGGTVAQLNALGIFNVNSDGYNKVTASYEGTWTYSLYTKTGEKITKIQAYIIDGGYNSDLYVNIATHELGHTIGWSGHSPIMSDVMYKTANGSNLALTSNDKSHIKQVYGK